MSLSRNWISSVLKEWKVPAAAVAVVKDGQIVSLETFGEISPGNPVDENTIFAVGSLSKAFTSTLAALEASRSEDTPLIAAKELLANVDSTRSTSLGALLTHTSRTPAHDFAWFGGLGDRSSRAAIVSAAQRTLFAGTLGFEKPSADFSYSNIGYCVAAAEIEKRLRQPWESSISNLMAALRMSASGCSMASLTDASNAAKPHTLTTSGSVVRVPFHNTDVIAPAGGIHSSIRDMSKWLLANVGANEAVLPVSARALLHTTKTTTAVGVPPLDQLWKNAEIGGPIGYGLGWFTYSYRGFNVVEHGGNIDGFTSVMMLLPKEKSGVVVLTNLQGFPFQLAPHVIAYAALDRLVCKDLETVPWNERALSFVSMVQGGARQMLASREKEIVASSRELATSLAGCYSNPLYGELAFSTYAEWQLRAELHGRVYDVSVLRSEDSDSALKVWLREGKLIPIGMIARVRCNGSKVFAELETKSAPIVFERTS